MECEMCGNPIYGRASRVRVEGTVMSTCKKCARFGAEDGGETARKRKPAAAFPKRRRDSQRIDIDELELVEDYGARIKRAREQRSLTHEELGNLIKEKTSVIARIESQRMGISEKMARKLERFLDVKLFEKLE